MTPQKKRHYSIRKLRAGVGSILIGTTLLFGLSTQLVQANTTADGTTTSDSAGGTTAAPGVTATGTNATTTATGGETATEEKPKVEEPKEKPVEGTPKETAPKAEDKKEAETPNAPTNPADYPIVKELKQLLEEVNKQSPLDETGPFKGQAEFWKKQGPLAEARLKNVKSKAGEKAVKDFLEDYVQYAKIEKMARHAQQLYKKHASSTEMLDLIKKAFEIGKDEDTYASLEGPNLVDYVNDDVIGPYNKIVELARKLDEEKAKKEKEKEQPAPAPTPEPKKDTENPAPSQPKQDDSMKKDYKLFYQTKDKTEEVNFKGTPEELKATLDKAIEKYKQDGYPYVDRFERENRILLVFNQHKSIIVLETNGDGGSRQSRPFYGTPQELEAEIKKLTESLSDTYKIEKKEGYDKLEPTVKTITLVLTKLSDAPAPSQPKQDDSMKKDYKLFYQTKDKTEEVDFKGTPEELKATLDKAIEKYKQEGYPYVDRFERENRILLVFNQHKSIIVLETNGDGGSRQSRPFYGTPQELEAEIKKLTESLSDTYKIEKKEGYDKLEPT
ncbi:GAG-binding domain-containing protein, partial [Streptococcus ruminantium]